MNIKAISTALKGKAGAANQFTPALNNITGKYPKDKNDKSVTFIHKGGLKKPEWKPKPGYKPSDGTGVGY